MKIAIDLEMQGTSVPLRWCLSKEELNKLAETVEKAYLLLSVIPDDFTSFLEETRYLIPVEQMMEYVDFYTPHRHRIFATVVWKREGEDLKKIFMTKEYERYRHSFYGYGDHPGKLEEYYFDVCGFGISSFEVDVPEEVFAKEPPAWEKR